MNAHEKRRARIIYRTKKSTQALFGIDDLNKISMEAIAAKANISPSTLYKYFHTKENLFRETISQYIDEILADTEKALDRNLDLVKRLKIIITAKVHSSKVIDSQTFYGASKDTDYLEEDEQENLDKIIKQAMYKLYEEAKREGYFEKDLSFDLFALHLEIFQSGFSAKSREMKENLLASELFDQLLNLYIFGLLGRK